VRIGPDIEQEKDRCLEEVGDATQCTPIHCHPTCVIAMALH
jgi:hypothetical protein